MPISQHLADVDMLISPAPANDDLSQANQGAKGISFLLEVRNGSGTTLELIDQIVEMMVRGGLDVTITPTEHIATSTLLPSQQVLDKRLRAAARGEGQLVRWTQDGTLVEGAKIQQAWGVTRQAVDAARDRGEIFSVWVKGQHWYPDEALKFKREDFAVINQELGEVDPCSKLLFLLHKHGAVDGMTPAEAVANRKLGDVLRLAAEWRRT